MVPAGIHIFPNLDHVLEEFTAELPLRDRAVEFVAWREHGCRWTESLMAGVIPGDLKRLFAAVRAASSRGPAKARLFVEEPSHLLVLRTR